MLAPVKTPGYFSPSKSVSTNKKTSIHHLVQRNQDSCDLRFGEGLSELELVNHLIKETNILREKVFTARIRSGVIPEWLKQKLNSGHPLPLEDTFVIDAIHKALELEPQQTDSKLIFQQYEQQIEAPIIKVHNSFVVIRKGLRAYSETGSSEELKIALGLPRTEPLTKEHINSHLKATIQTPLETAKAKLEQCRRNTLNPGIFDNTAGQLNPRNHPISRLDEHQQTIIQLYKPFPFIETVPSPSLPSSLPENTNSSKERPWYVKAIRLIFGIEPWFKE